MPKRGVERYDDDIQFQYPEDVQEAKRLKDAAYFETEVNNSVAQKQAALVVREERSLYLTVLHQLAVSMRFDSKSPIESQKYASIVFSRTPHECAFSLDKSRLVNLTHITCILMRFPAGTVYLDPETSETRISSGTAHMCQMSGLVHRCAPGKFCDKTTLAKSPSSLLVADDILREISVHRSFVLNDKMIAQQLPPVPIDRVDSNYACILFPVYNKHECSLDVNSKPPERPCIVFHLDHGTTYPDPFNEDRLRVSSGTLQICKESGFMLINLLGERQIFAKNYSAFKEKIQRHFQVCTRSRDQGYVCLLTNQHKANIVDQTPVFEKNEKVSLDRLEGYRVAQEKAEERSLSEGPGSFDDFMDEEEEDDLGALLEERLELPEDGSKPVGVGTVNRHVDPLDQLLELPHPEMRLGGAIAFAVPERPPVKRRLPFELEKSAELNSKKAEQILKTLSSYDSRWIVFEDCITNLAPKAHERLKQVQRQTKSIIPLMEKRRIWTEALVENLPLKDPEELEPLDPTRYVDILMRCWNRITESPFITDDDVNKRTQPTFAKMVVASIYRMAEGGFMLNCNFSPEEKKEMNLESRFPGVDIDKLKLAIPIFPSASKLAPHLVDKSFLTRLSGLLTVKLKFDDGMVGRGKQLLDASFNSLIRGKKQQVINTVAQCTTFNEVSSCLLEYLEFCNSLRCWGEPSGAEESVEQQKKTVPVS